MCCRWMAGCVMTASMKQKGTVTSSKRKVKAELPLFFPQVKNTNIENFVNFDNLAKPI